jgi:hypothetical protein
VTGCGFPTLHRMQARPNQECPTPVQPEAIIVLPAVSGTTGVELPTLATAGSNAAFIGPLKVSMPSNGGKSLLRV